MSAQPNWIPDRLCAKLDIYKPTQIPADLILIKCWKHLNNKHSSYHIDHILKSYNGVKAPMTSQFCCNKTRFSFTSYKLAIPFY